MCGQSGQLLIPQLMPWRDPEFPHFGEGDLPNSPSFLSSISACSAGKERAEQCMVRGDFSSHMQDFGKTPHSLSSVTATYRTVNAVSLQKRQNKQGMMRWHSMGTPNSLVCCPGKRREKQHMMRVTSHPTAHTGGPQHF